MTISRLHSCRIHSCDSISADGTVRSAQWGTFPANITAKGLLERYLLWVRKVTLTLVRPVREGDVVRFRLFPTPLSLLTFRVDHEDDETVRLDVSGGFLASRPDSGSALTLYARPAAEGLLAGVTLEGFHPGIMRIPLAGKFLYRVTQFRIHRLVTTRFLGRICRESGGSEVEYVDVPEGCATD